MKARSPIARMDFPELAASAGRMGDAGNRDGAIDLYRSWLKSNPKSSAAYAAQFNLGCLLHASARTAEALAAYAACLRANPQFVQVRLNIGNALEQRAVKPLFFTNPEEALGQLIKANE